MAENPVKKLETFGQSVWLDFIKRDLILSGELKRMIEEDGLRGMTSNPAIFEKAVSSSDEYTADIKRMAAEGKEVSDIYQFITQRDVCDAADTFRPLYDATDGADGYVSLEVNPHLAHDTKGTLEEARWLWKSVNRPNVLIKVPAALEGLPAIQQLISEGINVNVTLLFGLPRYRQVANAYLTGLETRLAQGGSIEHVVSVASFFLSRIDVLLDPILKKIVAEGGVHAELAAKLQGQVAVASAKAAYQIYHELFGSERFQKLAERGARVQRLLWASTGTKNPEYSDVKYVEPLIGPHTVNTLPVDTFEAYRAHGQPEATLERDVEGAEWVLQQLPKLGIDLDRSTQILEDQGVEKFNQPFDQLLDSLQKAL